MIIVKFSVISNIKKNRLDRFLALEIEELSRGRAQTVISTGCVYVNSVLIKDVSYNLKYKDEVWIDNDFQIEKPNLTPDSNIKFSIIYEDYDILVINKPAGIIVHPGAGNYSHTLVNGLIHHCGKSLSNGYEEYRPGIVHRIDKDTSGILIVAKNDFSHNELGKQFAVHSVKRKYICFCYSALHPTCGKIETFITRDRNNRLRMAVSNSTGKNAITIYKTIKTFSKFASKIECELKTGRTHQVRVHLSHRGSSLIGDSTYRAKNYFIPRDISDYINNFPRQALHAYFLEFYHPRFQKIMHFEVDLPDDMKELEDTLCRMIPSVS